MAKVSLSVTLNSDVILYLNKELTLKIVLPSWAGDILTTTPADWRAEIFSLAPPFPPAMMAPAWPILRPGGAVKPAMKDTTGFPLGP